MHNIIRLLTVVSLLATSSVLADSEFQKWMQQQQSSFQEYKDKRDKEFTAFLKNNWKEMQLLKGVERDKKPKPVAMPVARPEPITTPVSPPQAVPQPQLVKPPVVPLVPLTTPVPVAPTVPLTPRPVVRPQPAVTPEPVVIAPLPVVKPPVAVTPAKPKVPATPPVAKGRRLPVSFYGEQLTLYYDPQLRISIPYRITKQSISDSWSKLSRTDFEPLLQQLDAIKRNNELNDWAFAVLSNEVASGITPASNARIFLNWFLLIKAGYEARIAYDDSSLYLLLPTRQQLYSVPYFTFDDVRFYAVSFDGGEQKFGRVFTYDGRYPGANDALDMSLTSDIINVHREKVRKLNFEFKGKRYTVDARYDKQRIDFLNTYPQMDLTMYFSARVASDSASALHSQLAKYIQGMSQLDAVNLLLRFVQTSLPYKTDDAQFGKENYLFPEETLYYRYSDCEDRAVLFAWLVRNLLGLEVIGIDYPGHVATAVRFTVPVQGDAVSYKGKKYTIADPTYINAVAGMTMPDYRQTPPRVIDVN